jgi:predicted DNA-binding protein (MmcQ/YjbR family)
MLSDVKAPDPALSDLDRIRSICLGFPGAVELETWGHPTFRIGKKMFAAAGGDPVQVSFKATLLEQQGLIQRPGFSRQHYTGRYGWVTVDLSTPGIDWEEIVELLAESYELIAPARKRKVTAAPTGNGAPANGRRT